MANYDTSKSLFITALKSALSAIKSKLDSACVKSETFNESTLTLKDNTIFVYNGNTGLSSLTISYPTGDFTSTILFSTATSGNISVTFPTTTKFVGSASYEFFPGENWELNIRNGIVVGSVIT